MDILSVVGAAASLECAVLLIAVVLYQEIRWSHRRTRLVLSVNNTLQAAGKSLAPQETRQKAA